MVAGGERGEQQWQLHRPREQGHGQCQGRQSPVFVIQYGEVLSTVLAVLKIGGHQYGTVWPDACDLKILGIPRYEVRLLQRFAFFFNIASFLSYDG